jgi:hypothetical protein
MDNIEILKKYKSTFIKTIICEFSREIENNYYCDQIENEIFFKKEIKNTLSIIFDNIIKWSKIDKTDIKEIISILVLTINCLEQQSLLHSLKNNINGYIKNILTMLSHWTKLYYYDKIIFNKIIENGFNDISNIYNKYNMTLPNIYKNNNFKSYLLKYLHKILLKSSHTNVLKIHLDELLVSKEDIDNRYIIEREKWISSYYFIKVLDIFVQNNNSFSI